MKSKFSQKKVMLSVVIAIIAIISIFATIIFTSTENPSRVLTVEESQNIVDNTFFSIAKSTAIGTKKIFENTKITVKSVEEGNTKNLILHCDYSTLDISEATNGKVRDIVGKAYEKTIQNESLGISSNATKISIDLAGELTPYLSGAKQTSGSIKLELYEITEGNFVLYLDDKVVNTCTGGLLTLIDDISKVNSVEYNGETVDITKMNTIRRGVKQCFELKNYDNSIPDVGSPIVKWWNEFCEEFYNNFIYKSQWRYLSDGLLMTLSITGIAALIGIFLGIIVAIVRCTCHTTGKLKILDKIFAIYVTIMRGTPVMVQLLIVYFVFLLPIGIDKFPAAVLCFGLNSGAYVSEIVRGGILSIDKGQMEAGRSLGFNYSTTMIKIIIPQAFKSILPSLANEFITLLKESSVAFYIGVADLTQGGLKIRSITYSNFMPLIAVAIIYLILVMILTKLVSLLEKRLRKSDH